MNRRDFIKQASGMVALGGGLFMTTSGGRAAASVPETAAGRVWSRTWPPQPPQRLSETTRALAHKAIAGEHGRSMVKADFALDSQLVRGLSPDLRYGHACKLVAEKAPLRILPGEQIVGSATLLEAAAHSTPVANIGSVSHTTLAWDKVLKLGYRGLREQIEARLARGEFESSDPVNRTVPGPQDGAPAVHAGSPGWEAASNALYDAPPLTVECWAKLRSKNGFNALVLNRTKDSPLHWELYSYSGTGEFSAYLPGYAPCEMKSQRDITDGQWHYLAMVLTGDRVKLFVDGGQVADQAVTASGKSGPGSGSLYFGFYPPESVSCDGALGDVRISNAIREIHGLPAGPFEADAHTAGLWRVGADDPECTLADLSPAQNHARMPVARRGEEFLQAMLLCLEGAQIWHGRYMDELERLADAATGADRENYLRVRETLQTVPENPATNFREAVQSLWFAYAFQRLMGTWSGIGRIDEMLGPYLEKDLAEGRVTLDEAREVLAHFWVKGCEWIGAFDTRGSGDAQHYQNIVLAGVNSAGQEVANEVTYLVLDIVEELHISDFPIAVRVNPDSPDRLMRRIAEVQRYGGGIVAIYNENAVIGGLVQFGYPLEEARRFANDGCWEAIIPGKTAFSYAPQDALVLLHETLGLLDPDQPAPDYPDFESLYAGFVQRLRRQIDMHHRGADGWAKHKQPTPLVSLLVDDCIERGRGYYDSGAHYSVQAVHFGRLANVANSLLVIKRLVYEDGYITLPDFAAVLRTDWKDQENLRRLIQNRFEFYGNDNDEADAMLRRVFDDYTAMAAETRERAGVLRPAGISTFGREIEWSQNERARKASADGHLEGAVLATNLSPSPGTDRKGPTAVIKSYCKMDFTRLPNGATLELKIHPESVTGETGRDALVALTRSFVDLGGWFLHIDVVDSAMLLDAQRHPEKYPNLSVRIAGWSARFATMNKDWQDMVIARTQQFA
jgi:formate C-acetyltransferase